MLNIAKQLITGHSIQNNNKSADIQKIHQEILDYELAVQQNCLSQQDTNHLIQLYRSIINHYATLNDQKYKLFEKKLIQLLLQENQTQQKKGSMKYITESQGFNQSFEVRMSRQQIQTFINDRKSEQDLVNKLVKDDISKQQNTLYSRLMKRNQSIQPKSDNQLISNEAIYKECPEFQYQSQKNLNNVNSQSFNSIHTQEPFKNTESSHDGSITEELEQLEFEKNQKIEQVVKNFNNKIEKMRELITQSLDQNIIKQLQEMEIEKMQQIEEIEKEYERRKEEEYSIE